MPALNVRNRLLTACVAIGFASNCLHSGILVTTNGKEFQFSEALTILVNAKDKVLRTGSDPRYAGPFNKLPALKLEGEIIADRSASILALITDGSVVYLLPEGLPKGGPGSMKQAWSNATISYKKSKSDKSPESVNVASFVAYLPDGPSQLVALCSDPQLLKLISGTDSAVDTQLRLMRSAVAVYSSDPAFQSLQKYVGDTMRTRYQEFETGTAGIEALGQALSFAGLSQSVYPAVADQAAQRAQIAATKAWLDRRVAILRAFAAGGEWDRYILGDRDFEKYEGAYPELAQLRLNALAASLDLHKKSGEELLAQQEFEAAYREFRLASFRKPSDKLLQQKVLMTWTDYSRDVAIENQRNRKRLDRGEQEILNQAIQFATNYKAENKLDLALKSIQDAEAIDPNSLSMLLTKAEILGAQRNFTEAFATLDRYDLHAVEEERTKSSSIRNDLLFKQRSSLEDAKEQIRKGWAESSYHRLHGLALNGLRAKNDDAQLLYEAGVSSFVVRDAPSGRDFLSRYLQITNNLDADPDQRARVRMLLANLRFRDQAETGRRNWLSGLKLPPNAYYCPVSLAFQPRIEHIEASNKMRVNFEWSGEQLVSIDPVFEKAEKATGEKRISFVYDDAFPQVALVSDSDTRVPAIGLSTDPDERVKQSSLVVLNNPYLDPDALEKLTGRNVTLGISGNRFFEPFVWDKVHYFRFKYDQAGRVVQARELVDRNGPATDWSLDFEWTGRQLTTVKGFQGRDDKHRAKVYERTMRYEGDQLVAEDIQSNGKSSKIKYTYNGGHMVSAMATNDPTLDDRSRHVFFR